MDSEKESSVRTSKLITTFVILYLYEIAVPKDNWSGGARRDSRDVNGALELFELRAWSHHFDVVGKKQR